MWICWTPYLRVCLPFVKAKSFLLWRRANARSVSQHTLYSIQHIHINFTLISCTLLHIYLGVPIHRTFLNLSFFTVLIKNWVVLAENRYCYGGKEENDMKGIQLKSLEIRTEEHSEDKTWHDVHMYMIKIMWSFSSYNGYKLNSHHDTPPTRLHSSVGRASHRYRRGHGFESLWSPRIFSGLYL